MKTGAAVLGAASRYHPVAIDVGGSAWARQTAWNHPDGAYRSPATFVDQGPLRAGVVTGDLNWPLIPRVPATSGKGRGNGRHSIAGFPPGTNTSIPP